MEGLLEAQEPDFASALFQSFLQAGAGTIGHILVGAVL